MFPFTVRLPALAMVSLAPLCTCTDLATAPALLRVGRLVGPEGMTTSSVAVGTVAGFQLVASARSVEAAPVRVVWAWATGPPSRVSSAQQQESRKRKAGVMR